LGVRDPRIGKGATRAATRAEVRAEKRNGDSDGRAGAQHGSMIAALGDFASHVSHSPMQSMVTWPSPSAMHETPGMCVEQVSDGERVDSMQLQVGDAAHAGGTKTHVYPVGGVPPSALAIPGGCTSQN
jgi:hypothetical protein